MTEPTRCPYCADEGKRSSLYPPAYYYMTAMMTHPYYDEDGRRHLHNSNTSSGTWRCSRDHTWTRSVRPGCPAGCTEDDVTVRLHEEKTS